MPQGNPRPGEFYLHFKNKLYQIKDIAIHSETKEPLVIYQALYGDFQVYARPLPMFISEVDHVKYPEVTQKYRFQQVTPHATTETVLAPVEDATPVSSPAIFETEVREMEEPATPEDTEESGINPNLLRFLDTDSFEEKYRILIDMESEIDDIMCDNLAASIDVVIPDGPIDKRVDHLRYAVKKRLQFENDRLR